MNLLILGIGISKHKTDGVSRFESYCLSYGLNYRIVGDGEEWFGGDMSKGPGGGQKILRLKKELEGMENCLIVVCDTFDLFPVAISEEIIRKYHQLCREDQVLFAAELYCWPDRSLESAYAPGLKYRFLNSGSFIGYRDQIYKLVSDAAISETDDDQLYFTRKYLEPGTNIVLDTECVLFQALNGVRDDIVIHRNRVFNKHTNSYPVFIHGNGPSKLFLNHLENYIDPDPKIIREKYLSNFEIESSLSEYINHSPNVLFILYGDSSKDFTQFESFLKSCAEISYSNRKIIVCDSAEYNADIVQLVQTLHYSYHPETRPYHSINQILESENSTEFEYVFLLEQHCQITDTHLLYRLLPLFDRGHRVISPMLRDRNGSIYTNFWGDLDSKGYYKRSTDYVDIAQYNKRGIWNVPYVTGAILIDRKVFEENDLSINCDTDSDMEFCFKMRKQTIFMYVSNLHSYGYVS